MFLRKIKDIRISNRRISVIRDADISIDEIESDISKIDYKPARGDKNVLEENVRLPPFIQVFYFLFFSYLKIPTEGDFWNNYLTWIGGVDENGEIEIDGLRFKSLALRNRLNRTYPSLIRDLHFLYLLDASNEFEMVDYSMERDYINGLDLKITYRGKEVYISVFIDTSRGRYYKQRKAQRHDYSLVNEIQFSVDFNTLTKKGEIYLLNQSHVKILKSLLHEN